MADIAKVITVIGNSPDGFAEAAQVAVSEAAKTLRGITGADVLSEVARRRAASPPELRDRICAEFEAIEREASSDASFGYTEWDRTDHEGAPGGTAKLPTRPKAAVACAG